MDASCTTCDFGIFLAGLLGVFLSPRTKKPMYENSSLLSRIDRVIECSWIGVEVHPTILLCFGDGCRYDE